MTLQQKVLVTGPTGFIGRHLCAQLTQNGYGVRKALRHETGGSDLPERGGYETSVVGNINEATDWTRAVNGVDCIVHLAARVHVMREHETDPLAAYRSTNTFATINLARSAAAAGVRRLVFVSTIKVNGEITYEKPFRAVDVPSPMDAYAISKWEAEQSILRIGRESGLEVVIVRPPLVYGPGVKGNFLRLLQIINRGFPMPLAACQNKRSFVYLDNMVDLLIHCLSQPEAHGQIFLVSDGKDLSTPELVTRIAMAMDQKTRLISLPPAWLKIAAKLIGKPGLFDRLCGSLQLDIDHTCKTLKWTPPVSVDEGVRRTTLWYLSQRKPA
jgi:nucleoside-diphosphate-sugar epimerase